VEVTPGPRLGSVDRSDAGELMQIEWDPVSGHTGSGGELFADRVGGIFLVLANVFDDVGIG
jgi:hypothetical protein